MSIFKIFRMPKNQQFDYKPRFWDQKKEEFEERLKQYESRDNISPEEMKQRISLRFRKKGYVQDTGFRNSQIQRSNRTLLITLVVLILLSLFLIDNYFQDFILHLEKK